MQIRRLAYDRLKKLAQPGVVTIVYGPRRVGKTTLLTELVREWPADAVASFTGDSIVDRDRLAFSDQRHLRSLLGGAKYVVVDEAQRVPNIGLSLKLIVDFLPEVTVVVSGSATFKLAHQTEEPLTGRKRTLVLYPISYPEVANFMGEVEARVLLDRWLIWGMYPTAITTESELERKIWLDELVNGYLYKDILELAGVKHAGKIVDLLRLLAYQIGAEVSVSELGRSLDMTKETVARYLDLLQQNFVLVNVRGLARNLRKEISKNSRYYFWDNGVRNALINNFNGLKLRNDVGQLWENFGVGERLKRMTNTGQTANYYFWRTHDRKEIDWVEEAGGKFLGLEFKYTEGGIKTTVGETFRQAYPNSKLAMVNRDNFNQFID